MVTDVLDGGCGGEVVVEAAVVVVARVVGAAVVGATVVDSTNVVVAIASGSDAPSPKIAVIVPRPTTPAMSQNHHA